MNYNLGELEILFERIQDVIKYIEIISLSEKRFTLYLANGEKIKIQINKECIPHLLGINTDHLKLSGRYKGNTSYEILKNFLDEGAYKLTRLQSTGQINYDVLFSSFINEKIDGFKENMKYNTTTTKFVCKYSSERSYMNTTKNQKYDYILVKEIDDNTYGVQCLVEGKYFYTPMSNQIFYNKDDLNMFLEENIINQEITILTNVAYKESQFGDYQNFYLLPEAYIIKLEDAKEIKKEFSCIIDTTYTSEHYLKKDNDQHTTRKNETEIIENIMNAITEGKIVDSTALSDKVIKLVLDKYNDFVCKKNGISIDTNETYRTLKEELITIKEELEKVKEENSVLKQLNEEKDIEQSKLNEKIIDYENKKIKILELLNN